jgi:hypothetical protein
LFLGLIKLVEQIVRFAYSQDVFAFDCDRRGDRAGTIEGIDAGVAQEFHIELAAGQVGSCQ